MLLRRIKKNQKIAFCLGDGCGLGNLLQALTAVQALHEAGHTVDLFLSGTAYRGISEIVKGTPFVRTMYENTYQNNETFYDVCIKSFLSDHRVDNAKKIIKLKPDWSRGSEYELYCRTAVKLGATQFKPPALHIADRPFHLQPRSILFHAGCSQRKLWERKRWPHYSELAERLVQDGFSLYCCGAEDEIIHHPRVTAYNSLPIQETAALIQQCELFVSNDSGLMQLAAALRKKQIAIFTATNPKKSAPYYNPNSFIITPPITCFPCQGNETVWENCHDWRCREAITVDAVYRLIKKVTAA
ncbi:MAG: glycosyltransferase family 9 protein [Proteobacteria bacterium]|nr:glycosyltransferase family 9 protein [Pseudomonadota bacterium]